MPLQNGGQSGQHEGQNRDQKADASPGRFSNFKRGRDVSPGGLSASQRLNALKKERSNSRLKMFGSTILEEKPSDSLSV